MFYLAIYALCFTLFIGCNKWQYQFPEDEERSKLTPMERLTSKTWTLKKVELNNLDFTDSVFKQIGSLSMRFSTSEYENGLGSEIRYIGNASSDVEGNFTTTYKLYDNKFLNVVRYNTQGVNSNVLTIMHKIYDLSGRFGPCEIRRLDNNYLKIQFANNQNGGKGDSTIMNLFY